MNRIVSLASAVLLAGASGAATPIKNGPAFPLSSCANCTQDAPAVAGNAAGSLLAVWEGLAPNGARGVPARIFRPLGPPRGGDFFVRAAAAGTTLFDPDIAGDAKSFVAVWAQDQGDDSDVVAQRLTPRGVALGQPVAINVDDPALPRAPEDFAPAVAMAPGGGFVVAWVRFVPFLDSGHPGTTPAIFIRRFNADGTARGPATQISTGLAAAERPGLCVTTSGSAVVAWTSVDRYEPFQASLEGVSVRRLQPSGLPQRQTLVLSPPVSDRADVAVSCGKDGGYVVAWSDQVAPAAERSDIVAQRFGRDGKKAGAAFLANAATAGDQDHPALSHDPSGAFVLAWHARNGEASGIYLRRFTAAGAATSGDVAVGSDVGSRGAPALAHTGTAGSFVVAWPTASRKLVGQRFKP